MNNKTKNINMRKRKIYQIRKINMRKIRMRKKFFECYIRLNSENFLSNFYFFPFNYFLLFFNIIKKLILDV